MRSMFNCLAIATLKLVRYLTKSAQFSLLCILELEEPTATLCTREKRQPYAFALLRNSRLAANG